MSALRTTRIAVPRRTALAAASLLLLGPTVLAFFSGGYFDGPREWAGLVAWLVVAAGAALAPPDRRRLRAGALAVGGLAALAALTLLSMSWAPIVSSAYHAGQIAVLYLGALIAAALVVDRDRARLLEPVTAFGAAVVIGYGLAGRLLPGLLHYAPSAAAEGRLQQPLTYWNAMGELAALGLVLAAAVAGQRGRSRWLRALFTAAAVPFGAGVYVSFSRGALYAAGAGLLALLVLAPDRRRVAGLLSATAAAALGAVACAPFPGVTALSGSVSAQERDGAIVLGLLVVLMALSVGASWILDRRVAPGALALPRRSGIVAIALILAGLALAIVLGAKESDGTTATLSGGSSRLATLQSDRFDYWHVALRAFSAEPLRGVGAGNWSVYWLRWRTINAGAQDAHSLPLQTLAELGVLGALALLAWLIGIARVAVRALRVTPLAAGPVAALITYLVHSPLDWDWEMPAVTLPAMVLLGGMIALAATPPRPADAGRADDEPALAQTETAIGA